MSQDIGGVESEALAEALPVDGGGDNSADEAPEAAGAGDAIEDEPPQPKPSSAPMLPMLTPQVKWACSKRESPFPVPQHRAPADCAWGRAFTARPGNAYVPVPSSAASGDLATETHVDTIASPAAAGNVATENEVDTCGRTERGAVDASMSRSRSRSPIPPWRYQASDGPVLWPQGKGARRTKIDRHGQRTAATSSKGARKRRNAERFYKQQAWKDGQHPRRRDGDGGAFS